jgi:hypothetical protein
MKIQIYLFLISTVVLILFGCSPQTTEPKQPWEPQLITHPSLLGSENCRPPCWEGIIPDETSYEEALSIVDNLLTSNTEGSFKVGYYVGGKYIHWYGGIKGTSQENHVGIFFQHNLVSIMRLDFHETGNIDLGSLINHFGTPHGYDYGYDRNVFCVDTYFPNHGLVAESVKITGRKEVEETISEDMEITKVFFLAPDDPGIFNIKSFEYRNSHLNTASLQVPEYYSWEGFGVSVASEQQEP